MEDEGLVQPHNNAMTFRVNFYADQALLSMVKRILKNAKNYNKEAKMDFEPEETATSIIICHSACEAFLNIFATQIELNNFQEYEKKSILDKIEILYRHKNQRADWSKLPLQDIRTLDKIRNWLTHFKDSDIGLINSMGQWISDEVNKKPKVDDYIELKYTKVERIYKNIRIALLDITRFYEVEEYFEYLETENYNSYLIG